jgi:transposase
MYYIGLDLHKKTISYCVKHQRVQRLQTIPGMGRVTALTWALEMGDASRFRSIRQAISYCGLCGDEQKSAERVVCTPLSKQNGSGLSVCLLPHKSEQY